MRSILYAVIMALVMGSFLWAFTVTWDNNSCSATAANINGAFESMGVVTHMENAYFNS